MGGQSALFTGLLYVFSLFHLVFSCGNPATTAGSVGVGGRWRDCAPACLLDELLRKQRPALESSFYTTKLPVNSEPLLTDTSGFILIGLGPEVWSHIEIESEDYFFPLEPVINFCKLSEQCEHDFVGICGQDTLGITRGFQDFCDMYEYNCDDNKQYRHVLARECEYIFAANEPFEEK